MHPSREESVVWNVLHVCCYAQNLLGQLTDQGMVVEIYLEYCVLKDAMENYVAA